MNWEPGKPLITQSERFIIRSLSAKDAGPIYTSWWNDAEIQKGFNFKPRGWDQQRAAQHIETFDNRKKFHLGIFEKQTKKIIGFFAIWPNYTKKVALTNICIGDKAWWGKGVTLEVRARLLPFIFNTLGMEKVEGEIHGRNLPSIYNYKAMGFTPEAVVREHLISPFGGRVDAYHFGLLKEEWLEMRKAGKL
ncbi:MAG: GNAT family N-acetyltransferase [Proteobacteria bacterium]|nr:GNAT family N-acetyltransferase [Pseudomonadota bacterium]